jgi:hypothetical protein
VVGGSQARDRVWGGDLRIARQVRDVFEVALGVRGIFQRQPRDAARTYDWAVFLAASLRDRGNL